MSNEHLPDAIIIVYGPLGTLERAWKCVNKSGVIVYCSETKRGCTGCSFQKIAEEKQDDEQN